jgi:uncharacterized protein with FMN-binding domain
MNTRNAKSITALALTGIGSALVIGFQVPATANAAPVTEASTTATGTATTSSGTATTSSGTAAASPTTTAAASSSTSTTAVAAATTYADGTWTGSAVSEPWGTFQVQAVVSGGRITDVIVMSSPQDNHSSRINNSAVPTLTRAVIAAQSASVDMISGATWTSQSYETSLQAALDAAQAAAQAV